MLDPRDLTPAAQILRRSQDELAKKIEIQNHIWQIGQGHVYGCQFCRTESLALLWVDMYTCPLCGRKYDAILAADFEE
jgi:hypothetical protein